MSQPQPVVPSYSLISLSLLVNSIIFLTLATLSVALRFYARRMKSLDLQWDDWTIAISLVLSWAYSINTWVAAGIGGVDTTTLSPGDAAEIFERCLWIEGIPLGLVLATVKISVLLFYRRIFITRAFKKSVDAMVILLSAWAASTVIGLLFIASPISKAWKGGQLNYNFAAFSLAVAGMSIVFDVMVLCFPLPVIRTLRLPTRRKVQLAGVFWLGGFCCIAAALRIYYLHQGQQQVIDSPHHNYYYLATQEFIWAHIEPNCSIVAACLPTYGPLLNTNNSFGKWVHSLRSYLSSRSGHSNPSSSRLWSRGSKKGGEGSESGLVMDGQGSGHWQKLGKGGEGGDLVAHNVVDIAGGRTVEEEDLEAGVQGRGAARMNIAVKRGFGTEV